MDPIVIALLNKLTIATPAASVVFVMWYFYHKAAMRDRDRQQEDQRLREERDFKVRQDQVESLQYLIGILSRMEQKVDSNQWCPMIKREIGK